MESRFTVDKKQEITSFRFRFRDKVNDQNGNNYWSSKAAVTVVYRIPGKLTGVHQSHGSVLQIEVRAHQTEFRLFHLRHAHTPVADHRPTSVVLEPGRSDRPIVRFEHAARLDRIDEDSGHAQVHFVQPVAREKIMRII